MRGFGALMLVVLCLGGGAAGASSYIPFVGCDTEGMFPTPAPTDRAPMRVDWPANVAKRFAVYRLAVYPDAPPFIIAPRGWNCTGIASSSDVAVWVYPTLAEAKDGALVMYDEADGVSENYQTAGLAARYFPALFAAKDLEAADSMVEMEPRHPADKVNIMAVSTLMYETPGDTTGLGAMDDWLAPSKLQTDGFLKLYMHPHLIDDAHYVWFGIRLPPGMETLRPYLMDYIENLHAGRD